MRGSETGAIFRFRFSGVATQAPLLRSALDFPRSFSAGSVDSTTTMKKDLLMLRLPRVVLELIARFRKGSLLLDGMLRGDIRLVVVYLTTPRMCLAIIADSHSTPP